MRIFDILRSLLVRRFSFVHAYSGSSPPPELAFKGSRRLGLEQEKRPEPSEHDVARLGSSCLEGCGKNELTNVGLLTRHL